VLPFKIPCASASSYRALCLRSAVSARKAEIHLARCKPDLVKSTFIIINNEPASWTRPRFVAVTLSRFPRLLTPPTSVCTCACLSPSLVLARPRMTDCVARPRWRWCVVSINVDDVEWSRRAPVVGIRPDLGSKEDGCDDRAGVQRVRRFVSADRHWHEGEERPFCLSDRARRSVFTVFTLGRQRSPGRFLV